MKSYRIRFALDPATARRFDEVRDKGDLVARAVTLYLAIEDLRRALDDLRLRLPAGGAAPAQPPDDDVAEKARRLLKNTLRALEEE